MLGAHLPVICALSLGAHGAHHVHDEHCAVQVLVWRSSWTPPSASEPCLPLSLAVWNAGTSLALRLGAPGWAVGLLAVAWLGTVGGLTARQVHFRPTRFRVPLTPLTPSAAILATTHLIGAVLLVPPMERNSAFIAVNEEKLQCHNQGRTTLGWPAYARFGAR